MADTGQQGGPPDNLEFQGQHGGGVVARSEDNFQAPGEQVASYGPNEPYNRNATNVAPGENPPSTTPSTGPTVDGAEKTAFEQGMSSDSSMMTDTWLINKAHELYTYSTDYLDANITNTWERNIAHFHNEHAPGTVYRRKDFRRSSVFRPKTRANVKQSEAALANAAFSTLSLVSVTAHDERDPKQKLSAAINQEILQYRLEHTIPWFMTVLGAWQDAKVYGVCITHQHWRYREDTDVVPAFDAQGKLIIDTDPETGEDVPMGEDRTIVREDKPASDNVAPENFRFDPMCDWRDPANTSPYLVYMMPIYAGEALEMMEMIDNKTGHPVWKKYTLADILGTRRQDYDRTRQAREGRERIDPADEQHGNEFTTLWAHMNILKVNGTDYVYWTMGTELLLTTPIPLMDAYPWLEEGERPFRVGFSNVETHRNYPSGDVEQSAGLQTEINAVANQRLDNVKLVLNKRYFVRRGSQVDLDALIRNVPGGGVMMNDPERDVEVVNTPDVTGSSYQEQDRLSMEFDDLVGNFSPGQAQNQNQSVGGLSMIGSSANAVQDLSMKVFIETWMEPTLKQLVRLEQMYETDLVLLALARDKAQAFERYGVTEVNDDLLTQSLTVRVNVGMGNTDPMRRVERLVFGVDKAMAIPGMAQRVKAPEIADEVFGSLGYKDSSRFFMNDEEFEAYQAENPPQPPLEHQEKMRELDIREQDNQMRDSREREKIERGMDTELQRMRQNYENTLEQLAQRDAADRRRSDDQRQAKAADTLLKTREMNIKQATGSGI